MKICPTCNQKYTDESLNFCLTDGAVLNMTDEDSTIQPTVFIPQAPQTHPNQAFGNQTFQTPNQGFGNQSAPPNWGAPQPTFPQPTFTPPRKSRAGLWILGIVGAVILVSAIGIVGLIAFIASNANTPDSTTFTNSTYKTVLKEDFSGWRKESSDSFKTEYINGEYQLTSKQAGYFYVLISGRKDFKTTNASTKVTVRNVRGTTTPLGYGLLIHSNPNVALLSDYVFLIDSTTQSYRVAMHTVNKETNVLNWTRFNAIRTGTQANDIEVKDENGKMTFFINGQLATTLQNTTNYKDGIVGIYAGDAIPIAFSNLRLGK